MPTLPARHSRRTFVFVLLTLLVAACSSDGGGAAASAGPPTVAPSAAASSGGRGGDYDYGGGASSPSAVATVEPSAGATVELGTGTGAAGTFLTRPDGMTLYVFTKDTDGASACTDTCAENWPPLTVPAGTTPTAVAGVTGALSTFARADGSLQVAYDGKPLYAFIGDTSPGDTRGQGVNEVWFIAEP